jgi:MFS transporter, AAHS family, 4-hydroxybenzoate transporter
LCPENPRNLKRKGADRYVNAGALLLGAIAVASVALVRETFALFAGVLFFAGFFTGGAASGLTALVAISYPTALRSTGIGWAIAVARLGSAVGPLAAGIIISKGGARAGVFEALGLCGLVAAVAILILRVRPETSRRIAEFSEHEAD